MRPSSLPSLALAAGFLMLGCSGNSSTTEESGLGGSPGAGGTTANGGSPGTGGTTATGGAVATGGSVATGGTRPTGGSVATGGTPATGGAAPSGGATTLGGAKATGGTPATGGNRPGGGTSATGGVVATAGAGPRGGNVATGGVVEAGGMSGTAGRSNTGGAVTGGATATGTGGISGSGGSKSAGCGKSAPATRLDAKTQQTMTISGTTRYYLAYIPTTYDPNTPLPMVFALHGMNMNNWWAANDGSGFKLIEASASKAILVYPQGTGDAPGTTSKWGGINSSWSDSGADMTFIDTLLKTMNDTYCVDTSRIFVTGFSMGGMMTESLACGRSKVFRAFAPVAGWGPGGMGGMTNPTCSDSSVKVPIIITQGTTDGTVTPAMGTASRNFWTGRNGCTAITAANSTGGNATCVAATGCPSGLEVSWCTHGGGHMVPGNSGSQIWSFFNSYN